MTQFAHPQKILVTSAMGEAGGAIVAQLLEKGLPVRAIVRSRMRGANGSIVSAQKPSYLPL